MTIKLYQRLPPKDPNTMEDIKRTVNIPAAGGIIPNQDRTVATLDDMIKYINLKARVDTAETEPTKYTLGHPWRKTLIQKAQIHHQAVFRLRRNQRVRRQWPPNNGAVQTPLGAAKNKTEKEGENVDTAEKPHMVKTKKPVNDPEKKLF